MTRHTLGFTVFAAISLVAGCDRASEDPARPAQAAASQLPAPTEPPQESLSDLVTVLQREWPDNRTVRFVFHGHSVPAGYFKTPIIQRFDSYPLIFQQRLCERFPTAPIDVSVTAIGGESSDDGAKRFDSDVLSLDPDVVFIDYCLNDRRIGLDAAKAAWRQMIRSCIDAQVQVVLLTPTPDASESLTDDDAPLAQHSRQVQSLAAEFGVPLVNSFSAFRELVSSGADLQNYLAQPNHPNRDGHVVVADLLMSHFTVPDADAQQNRP